MNPKIKQFYDEVDVLLLISDMAAVRSRPL